MRQPPKIKAYLYPMLYQLVIDLNGKDINPTDIASMLSWCPSRQRVHQILKDRKINPTNN